MHTRNVRNGLVDDVGNVYPLGRVTGCCAGTKSIIIGYIYTNVVRGVMICRSTGATVELEEEAVDRLVQSNLEVVITDAFKSRISKVGAPSGLKLRRIIDDTINQNTVVLSLGVRSNLRTGCDQLHIVVHLGKNLVGCIHKGFQTVGQCLGRTCIGQIGDLCFISYMA